MKELKTVIVLLFLSIVVTALSSGCSTATQKAEDYRPVVMFSTTNLK